MLLPWYLGVFCLVNVDLAIMYPWHILGAVFRNQFNKGVLGSGRNEVFYAFHGLGFLGELDILRGGYE